MPKETDRFVLVPFVRDNPKDSLVADILEDTAQIIGTVLTISSVTELTISNIIADYFGETEEKRELILSLLIGANLNSASKRRILMYILTEKYPEIPKHYPDLEDRLKKLAEFRNRCAHSFPDATDEYLAKKKTGRIRLVWYEGGIRKYEDVTYAEAKARVREYVKVLTDVNTIQDKIGIGKRVHTFFGQS